MARKVGEPPPAVNRPVRSRRGVRRWIHDSLTPVDPGRFRNGCLRP